MSLDKRPLITSVRCEVLGNHCHVTVWNRGQHCGVLVVSVDGDAHQIAKRLIPNGCEQLDDDGRLMRWALAQATVQRDGYTLTATQDDEEREVVTIAINGESVGNVRWNAPRFEGYVFRFTGHEAENDDARGELEAAYAESLDNLPDPV